MAKGLAQPGHKIFPRNKGVVKATPTPRKHTVKDQDYRNSTNNNVTAKHLTMCWTLGCHKLHQATTYQFYVDIHGNNNSDTSAHMDDNFLMDLSPP